MLVTKIHPRKETGFPIAYPVPANKFQILSLIWLKTRRYKYIASSLGNNLIYFKRNHDFSM